MSDPCPPALQEHVLESLEAIVYVADMERDEVLYLNDRARVLLEGRAGEICWHQLQPDQAGRCASCANTELATPEGSPVQPREWEFQSARDGEWYHVVDKAIEWTDGRLVRLEIATNITERKWVDEHLRLTQFTVDQGADPVFWMQRDARFFYVNDAACRALGYKREELLGMTVHDIDPGFPPEAWPPHWEEIERKGSLQVYSHHRRKDGSLFPVEITANYIAFGGREYNCATARDISDRKKAEEERRALEAQMQHAQKLESLGVMAGGIAHDFNNLLMSILGNADLALRGLSQVSPARPCVEDIKSAARHAADLTRQMLAYSGKGRFVIQSLDLSELVEAMGHLLETSISPHVKLRLSLSRELPAIQADAVQLQQVVMNLITNAAESYGEGGSGVVAVATGAMECSREYMEESYLDEKRPEGWYVYLEVSDTGCGMDEETIAKIFDPFYSTKFTGRGLGLSAVLGIVRGHEGAIRVTSAPGRGSRFRVLFPARAVEERPLPEKPDPIAAEEWRGRGTILLVDDQEAVLRVATRMLTEAGFEVLSATDGLKALSLIDERGRGITCVLLDLTMPGMGGEETFRELKRRRPELPVILSSGYNVEEAADRFAGEGLAGFIQKPYEYESLTAALREVLGG